MLTVVVIVSLALHAISFFLHGLQKQTNSKFVGRLADDADRASDALEGIADKLEPKPAVKSGVATILLVLMLGIGASQLSACNGAVPVPVTDIIDCTKLEGSKDWASATATLSPDLGNWSKMWGDIVSIAPSFVFGVAYCVGEELISQYLSTKHATPDSWQAHDVAEKIRAAASSQGKSVTFQTSLGNL